MHWIECVVYKEGLGNPLLSGLRTVRYLKLNHAFISVPIDDQLLREFVASSGVEVIAGSNMLGEEEPGPVPVAFLEAVSRHHTIAWVRTRYFGGTGEQAAGVWEGGCVVLGPLVSRKLGPINAALSRIGVPRSPGSSDEFDSLGLTNHRSFDRSSL